MGSLILFIGILVMIYALQHIPMTRRVIAQVKRECLHLLESREKKLKRDRR